MLKTPDGIYVLELNEKLSTITLDTSKGTNFITEEQFKAALKDFGYRESLEILGSASNNIYVGKIHDQWERLGKGLVRNKLSGLFVHQSAIEYLANMFIISDLAIESLDSLKFKDNFLGLFNIYNNSLVIGSIKSRSILSIMVTMWQEQFRTQSNDLQAIGRSIFLFELNSTTKILGDKTIGDIFFEQTGLTIEEYLNIVLVLFSYALTHPKIIIGDLSSDSANFKKIINNESVRKFLLIYSATIPDLKKIDEQHNSNLNPKDTKNRFNPLWVKPMIKLEETEYVVPSITCYIQSLFNGLYWWFDDLFINQKMGADIPKTTFRDIFGKNIFEPYVGTVLKDIYGEKALTAEIKYSKKGGKAFTDWVVIQGEDAYLFEVKAYQFPFKTLQSGELELIAKEITKKLIQDTVVKINNKIKDIHTEPELLFLKDKKIIPVVVTYNVPLIDTTMYRMDAPAVIDEASAEELKKFNGYFLNISDLEYFKCIADSVELKEILSLVQTNNSNFLSEVIKIHKINNTDQKTISERKYDEKMSYISDMIKPIN